MHDFDNPINLPIKTTEGCKGCGGIWRSDTFGEGQCPKCHRCLDCCGSKAVKFSCAWKYERDYAHAHIGKKVKHDRHVAAGILGYMQREDSYRIARE